MHGSDSTRREHTVVARFPNSVSEHMGRCRPKLVPSGNFVGVWIKCVQSTHILAVFSQDVSYLRITMVVLVLCLAAGKSFYLSVFDVYCVCRECFRALTLVFTPPLHITLCSSRTCFVCDADSDIKLTFNSLLIETVAENFSVRSCPGASVAGGRRGDRISRKYGSFRIGSGGYKDTKAYFISAKPSQALLSSPSVVHRLDHFSFLPPEIEVVNEDN